MNFTIKRNDSLSGLKASVYSVSIEEDTETLLERFINENKEEYRDELREILLRLKTIGHNTGARQEFFKPAEGKPGDGIEALYDEQQHLRLYCIRNGRVALIVGGGGPKQGGAWQDYPKLKEENELLQLVSQTIIKALKERDIRWSDDGMELLGPITLSTDDY